MGNGKERFSPEEKKSLDTTPQIEIDRYVSDREYREKIKHAPEFAPFFYYEKTDQLGSILADRNLNWRPEQITLITKIFAKQLTPLYDGAENMRRVGEDPEFAVEKDLGLAAKDAEELPRQLENAVEAGDDSGDEGKSATGEYRVIRAEIENARADKFINILLFKTDPMYRLIFRRENPHGITIAEAELLDIVKQIISHGRDFALGIGQLNTLLASVDEGHEKELRRYAEEIGLLTPQKKKIAARGEKLEEKINEEFRMVKNRYVRGDITREAFKATTDAILKKGLGKNARREPPVQ